MVGVTKQVRGAVDGQGRTVLSTRVPASLRKRLKVLAIQSDKTLGAIVAEALEESLARIRKGKAKVLVLRRGRRP